MTVSESVNQKFASLTFAMVTFSAEEKTKFFVPLIKRVVFITLG